MSDGGDDGVHPLLIVIAVLLGGFLLLLIGADLGMFSGEKEGRRKR